MDDKNKEDEMGGHVACMRLMRKAYTLVRRGRGHLEDRKANGRTLKLVLRKYRGRMWMGFMGSNMGPVAGSCEQGNGPPDFIKCGEFPDSIGFPRTTAFKMEARCFSETSVSTYQSTRRHNPKHHHRHLPASFINYVKKCIL
jgi:hypothetical protein